MWLVDGNNVMGARPDGWWRDREDAMRRLVDALDAFAQRTGDDVVVVFDGRARDLRPQRIEVAFAAHADDLVAERAAPGTTVVTSDAELARRVRARGAQTLGAGAFRTRLGS